MSEKYFAKINDFLYGKSFFYSPSCDGFYSNHSKTVFNVWPVRKNDSRVCVQVSIWHAKIGRYISNLYTIKASDNGFVQRLEKKIYIPAMEAYAKQDIENQKYESRKSELTS